MNEKASEKRFHFNIIDVLVLLLLAAVVTLVAVRLVSLRTQKSVETVTEAAQISGPPSDFVPNLRFEVLAEGIESSLARRIAADPDNRIYNSYRLLDAYIVDTVCEPYRTILADSNGNVHVVEDPTRLNIRFTVEAMIRETDAYSSISGNFNACLGAQEIRQGNSYILKTMSIELPTTVTRLEAPIDG